MSSGHVKNNAVAGPALPAGRSRPIGISRSDWVTASAHGRRHPPIAVSSVHRRPSAPLIYPVVDDVDRTLPRDSTPRHILASASIPRIDPYELAHHPVLPSSRPPVLDFPDRPPTLSFFPHPDSRPYRQQPSRRAGSSSKRRTKSPPRLPSPPKRSSTSQNCSCSRARRQRCDGTLIANKRQTRSRRRSCTAST